MLHGGFNSQVGLAKSFEVNPGDIFDIEVYAKYQDLGSTSSNYAALFNALVSAFSLSSSGGTGLEGQQAYNTFEGMFSAAPFIETNLDDDESAPKAYLNYILFDEDFVLQDFGFDQIDASANQSAIHDYLSLHVKVEQKGYLYIYLSNENPTLVDVFFDDFKIVHHTGVEQVSDFYAFGLQINSLGYQRPNATANKFLYNGKESQPDIDASIYDYGARMYLSDIGRWGVIDPLAEVTYQISPFVYTYNNPINFIDPNGMLGVGAYGESLGNGAVSVWFNASPFTFEGAAYTDIESLQQAMLESVLRDVAKDNAGTGKPNTAIIFPTLNKDGSLKGDGNGALKLALEAAKKIPNINIIHAKDVGDAADQISAFDSQVDNLIIASHGFAREAYFKIGSTTFRSSKEIEESTDLSRIAGKLSENAEVVLLACHAGSITNGGWSLLKTLSSKLNATVYGNQSWTWNSSSMFSNIPYYQKAKCLPLPGRPDDLRVYKNAIEYNGFWSRVTPDGKTKFIYDVYFNASGKIQYSK